MPPRFTCATLLFVASIAAIGAEDQRLSDSRALAKALGKTLQVELVVAMKQGGPVAAIEVCNVRAPGVAADLSAGAAQVGRTALKLRNRRNAPDAEAKAVMRGFEKALADGPDRPPESFVVREDGSARYMRAIPTGAACLACHGDSLAPDVSAQLEALYPEDEATGFSAGQLRGAFIINWPAPESHPGIKVQGK